MTPYCVCSSSLLKHVRRLFYDFTKYSQTDLGSLDLKEFKIIFCEFEQCLVEHPEFVVRVVFGVK